MKLRTKLLTSITGITTLSCCAVGATSCSTKYAPTPEPKPEIETFFVEQKEYKITNDNKLSFVINGGLKIEHALSNIELLDGDNVLSSITSPQMMVGGEAQITFENVNLSEERIFFGEISFNFDDEIETTTISNLIISKQKEEQHLYRPCCSITISAGSMSANFYDFELELTTSPELYDLNKLKSYITVHGRIIYGVGQPNFLIKSPFPAVLTVEQISPETPTSHIVLYDGSLATGAWTERSLSSAEWTFKTEQIY